MRPGRMNSSGDVVLARVQFVNSFNIKVRPALVLFSELDNIVVAGITSNPRMKGVSLTKEEGAIKDSIIKLNYIFTISPQMISKTLFKLDKFKRNVIFEELTKKLVGLKG